jgi:hypothetical protein
VAASELPPPIRAHRDAFGQANAGTLCASTRCCNSRAARTIEVLLGFNAFNRVEQDDLAVVTHGQFHRIAEVDEAEYRLQQVITVSALADDMQQQVEFGRAG